MKNLKKIIALILLGILVCGLIFTGCKKEKASDKESDAETVSEPDASIIAEPIIESGRAVDTEAEVNAGQNEGTTEDQKTVTNYEDSVLYGESYWLRFMAVGGMESKEDCLGYTKYVNGKESLYKPEMEEGFYFTEIVYCDGTEVYVYTDKIGDKTLPEKVWIKGAENPYEELEKDVYAATLKKFIDVESYKIIDEDYIKKNFPFIYSLGFKKVEYVGDDVQIFMSETGSYYIPMLYFGSAEKEMGFQVLHQPWEKLNVPQMDEIHDISEY